MNVSLWKKLLSYFLILLLTMALYACSKPQNTPPQITPPAVPPTTEQPGDPDGPTEQEPPEIPEEPTMPKPIYYTNPVYREDRPDPHVIRHDGTFYLFSTERRILSSTDLISWSEAGVVFPSTPKWGTPGAGFWAPDVKKIADKFLIYYSLSTWGDSNPGIGVASADHPLGPWSDHGELFRSKSIGVDNSIDPDVFVAQDGRVYMIWGSFRGLYGIELTADGLALKDGSIAAASRNKTLVAGIVGPWNGNTYEGSYIVYKDGWYYLFASLGTCCEGLKSTYRVRVARSKNPLGPYVDDLGRDMLGENRGHLVMQGNGILAGPGHNSVVLDDIGQYWIIYHVWLNDNGTGKGRYVAIDKLEWEVDGWPQVSYQTPSTSRKEGPVFFRDTDLT